MNAERIVGSLRDEALRLEVFGTLLEVKVPVERRRQHYNGAGPRNLLGYQARHRRRFEATRRPDGGGWSMLIPVCGFSIIHYAPWSAQWPGLPATDIFGA